MRRITTLENLTRRSNLTGFFEARKARAREHRNDFPKFPKLGPNVWVIRSHIARNEMKNRFSFIVPRKQISCRKLRKKQNFC